eukprot:3256684-Prymnesium_polylepis.1
MEPSSDAVTSPDLMQLISAPPAGAAHAGPDTPDPSKSGDVQSWLLWDDESGERAREALVPSRPVLFVAGVGLLLAAAAFVAAALCCVSQQRLLECARHQRGYAPVAVAPEEIAKSCRTPPHSPARSSFCTACTAVPCHSPPL